LPSISSSPLFPGSFCPRFNSRQDVPALQKMESIKNANDKHGKNSRGISKRGILVAVRSLRPFHNFGVDHVTLKKTQLNLSCNSSCGKINEKRGCRM
jgi:hypothetical protein